MNKAWIALLGLALITGCATGHNLPDGPASRPSNVGQPNLDAYKTAICFEGPPEIEQAVRPEMVRQLTLTGLPMSGRDHCFYGYRLEPEGTSPDMGDYGDLDGASVHGAYSGRLGQDWSTFWFAFPEGGKPHTLTVSHEALHCVLVLFLGIGGHPATVEINGVEWKTADIMRGGTRWPMRAWRATVDWLTPWSEPVGIRERVCDVYYGPETSGFEKGDGI